ncbi:hypothetical protein ALC53_04814 [Atta colombica]|uniref:Uncharacterized protein n=1 Tax=Atta colombica TaxID=520822 RepID=A0A195BIV7_9HYME|nr:hypothetical protein ALC53_04814 [Atta colombica]
MFSMRVSRYPRRRMVEERAAEDIDKIIPPVVPFLHRSNSTHYFEASLWHISLVSVFLCPFSTHLSRAHLPTASRTKRGWLEGKRICEKDERGGREDEWKPPQPTQP